MPNLKFQSPEGKVIEIDSPDGSIPSEQELDQLFAMDVPKQQSVSQQGSDLSSLQNPSEITKDRSFIQKALPSAGQFAGGIVGGVVGGLVGKNPASIATGSAIGGTVGRAGGTLLAEKPLETLANPMIGYSSLSEDHKERFRDMLKTTAMTEAVAAPLGVVGSKVAGYMGQKVAEGFVGKRVAQRGAEVGWSKFLDPKHYKEGLSQQLVIKTNNFFKNLSNTTGEAIDSLINKKYKNTVVPVQDIQGEVKGLLPKGISLNDLDASPAQKKMLASMTNDIMSLGVPTKEKLTTKDMISSFNEGREIKIPDLWEMRKRVDKISREHNWSQDSFKYLRGLRQALNSPIKKAGDDIATAFDKYAFVKTAEDDLGSKFISIKAPSGKLYSQNLESFVSNLFSTSKDQTTGLLKELDTLNKLPHKTIDDLLDYAAVEALDKDAGMGKFQQIMISMVGGLKNVARAGAIAQNKGFQQAKTGLGRGLVTGTSEILKPSEDENY